MPDDVRTMHEQLDPEWSRFLQVLQESELMLKKHKDKFKTGLLQQSDEFKKTASAMLADFTSNGPFSAKLSPTDALSAIAKLKEQLALMKQQEAQIKAGLSIFKIDQPASKDLLALERDIELIETIWTIALDWDNSWSSWKTSMFSTLQTSEMEQQSQTIFKKLHKMHRELRDKGWDILDQSYQRVDQFRRTMVYSLNVY